jgi:hypothetical protein
MPGVLEVRIEIAEMSQAMQLLRMLVTARRWSQDNPDSARITWKGISFSLDAFAPPAVILIENAFNPFGIAKPCMTPMPADRLGKALRSLCWTWAGLFDNYSTGILITAIALSTREITNLPPNARFIQDADGDWVELRPRIPPSHNNLNRQLYGVTKKLGGR